MSIQTRQPKVTHFINKQLEQKKISHAYLLVGETDTVDVAYYIAQKLFCQNGGCGMCQACQRIKNNEHGDFVFISGKDQTIKKEAVLEIKSRFVQTSLEDVNHKVYVIEDVDNATHHAMNSFLKFLEEPESDVVAILTTSNLNRVLETIKSRCMILHLEQVNPDHLKESLIEAGMDQRDALILSRLSNSMEEAEEIHADPLFHKVVDTFETMKHYYHQDAYDEAGIHLQVVGIKQDKFDLKAIRWLCQLHILEFGQDYKNMRSIKLIQLAIKIQDRIRPGVISGMLIDQFVYELNQSMKEVVL